MKFLLIISIFIFIFISISCDKNVDIKDVNVDFKKIDDLIYNGNYSDAEKYINALLFMKKDEINKDDIKTLNYKLSKLYYIYLDRKDDAYIGLKKIVTDEKNIIDSEILEYLADISKEIKPKEEMVWLKKMITSKKIDKEYLYRYIKLLQKSSSKKELRKILEQYEDDIYVKLLNIELIKNSKNAIKKLDKYLNMVKNSNDYDQLLFRKISLLEESDKVDYKKLLNELSKFKTDFYIDIISQKRRYYQNKIDLSTE